jgi:hypothetical protein
MSQRQSEFAADTGWEAGEGVAVGEDVVDRSSLNLKRRALHTPLSLISAVTNVPFLPSPPTAEIYYGRSAVFRFNPKYKIMHLAMLLENAIGEDTGMILTVATPTHVYSACMAQIPEPSFPDISVILAKSTSSPTQSHQPCSTHSPSSHAAPIALPASLLHRPRHFFSGKP